MSPEEIELFQSYRRQLDEGFNLFRQSNLAIAIQGKELKKLKVQMELKHEEFNRQRDASKKVLDDIRRDIDMERCLLRELKGESNEYRRRIRYFEKELSNLDKWLPTEESSEK